jgi:predicted enzyme related to lactoylglutathione lyase
MKNLFNLIELQTTDATKAKTFYQGLFEWKMNDVAFGPINYTYVDTGDRTQGGIMKNPVAGQPSHWFPYVLVDDVAKAAARAKELGGTIVRERTEIPGQGWLAVVTDPTGALFGIWQQKEK